jgi:hypothetical protein
MFMLKVTTTYEQRLALHRGVGIPGINLVDEGGAFTLEDGRVEILVVADSATDVDALATQGFEVAILEDNESYEELSDLIAQDLPESIPDEEA